MAVSTDSEPPLVKKDRDRSPGVILAIFSAMSYGGLGGGAQGHVGQLEHLLVGGVGDLLAAIADILEPQPGHGVDGGVAQSIGNPDTLAGYVDGGSPFSAMSLGSLK